MKYSSFMRIAPLFVFLCASCFEYAFAKSFIDASVIKKYVDIFNADDDELYIQHIPNASAAEFLSNNIALFECPDKEIEAVYYFRWWTFRKHIKRAEDGTFVITEFLPPVSWGGKHNAISCAAAFHFREGRWLRDTSFLESYARYWFDCGNNIRRYSFWPARAILDFCTVSGNKELLRELYPKMKDNFAEWERRNRASEELPFWQIDSRDGMEKSISGKLGEVIRKKSGWIDTRAWRPTINSYMYGECSAIAEIAKMLGNEKDARKYANKALELKKIVNEMLWDNSARFYKPIPVNAAGTKPFLKGSVFPDVRELHGYTPWLFNIPSPDRSDAWAQISDASGFKAPFGLTTAEQRHREFAVSYSGHECLWDGPVWPYATSITLLGLANLLNDYPPSDYADKSVYFEALQSYAMSHHRIREDGKRVFWIDENINPYNGDWISRTRLKTWSNGTWSESMGGRERGKDYNHSEFCDIIITGLVGFRPGIGDSFSVNPLIPDYWDYFCLQNLKYRGRNIDVVYDKRGDRYGLGAGLFVLSGGRIVAKSDKIAKLHVELDR